MFKIDSANELKSISDDVRGRMKHDEFINMYDEITSTPYSFIFVNNQKQKKERFWYNFEKPYTT